MNFFRVLFLVLLSQCAWAQKQNIFLGALTIKGANPYSYRIEFNDSANIITGYSITDIGGPDQTKAAITGSVNPNRKELSFRETYIISTRSKTHRDSFCYIRAKLKLTERRGAKILSGNFTGYMKDGKTICGSGQITLVSKSDVIDKLMKIGEKGDSAIKMIEKLDREATKQKPDAVEVVETHQKIDPGNTKYLPCRATEAVISVWDNNKVDDDIITLKHNHTSLLSHYKVSGKKEQFKIAITPGAEERITMISESEGSEPPTTVRLICTCGDIEYTIDASSAIGRPVELVLRNN